MTQNKKEEVWLPLFRFGDPAGARTQDPNIKSVVLYLLSYEISGQNGISPYFGGAKVEKKIHYYKNSRQNYYTRLCNILSKFYM